jgi:peptidoglycan/xylan/chitin deacetylase (PgdA/CDA1 family)
MPGYPRISGKRESLARAMAWSGVSSILAQLPPRDSLLVLAWHRIGNAGEELFDPGVFSATADQLDEQISSLKRRLSVVTLEEALAFIGGAIKEKKPRCRALLTFDDGYLDNYQTAFPILRSHGVQGVFFLATSMVGSSQLPWWDRIAWLVRTARKRQFVLSYPANLNVDINKNGLSANISAVLNLYKTPENLDPTRFIRELVEEAEASDPPKTARRFLNWDEAREMSKAGMAFGSHTHSHQVLNRLEPHRQFEELSQSQSILKEQLGTSHDVLAYPVGSRISFSEETKRIAGELGYSAAFSHYRGINLPGVTDAFDVKRNKVFSQTLARFDAQSAMCRVTGNFWP